MIGAMFPAGLFGLSLLLLLSHLRTWLRFRTQTLAAVDRRFRSVQLRRRLQSSSLLALIGPAMYLGIRLAPDRFPRLFVTLWLTVLVATCWIFSLAILDVVASGRHFRQLSRDRAAERARLRAEIDRILVDTGRAPPGADIL